MSLNKRDSWRTPPKVFEYFNKKYNFTLDIASSVDNHLCDKYLTREDDALSYNVDTILEDGDYIWCNPPYSDVRPWVSKAIENKIKGFGTVMLLKNDTSTKWFKDIVNNANEVVFVVGGRIQFLPPDNTVTKSSNNFSSVFAIFHPRGDEFRMSYVDVGSFK